MKYRRDLFRILATMIGGIITAPALAHKPRRIYYVDVGSLPPEQAREFIETTNPRIIDDFDQRVK
jgi:hypothetical protein